MHTKCSDKKEPTWIGVREVLCLIAIIMPVCQAIDVYPVNIAVRVGERVTLQCAKSAATYFQWHEHVTSDSGQVISTNALVKHVARDNRYNISRQVAGHYDLVIRHAAFDDAGRYTCAVIDSGELRSAYVIVLGSDPICDAASNVSSVAEGDTITYSCAVTYSGRWPPVMLWAKPSGHSIAANNATTEPSFGHVRTVTSTSIRVPARVSTDGRSFTYFCRAYFDRPRQISLKAAPTEKAHSTHANNVPTYEFSYVTRRLVISYSVRNFHVVSPKSIYLAGDTIVLRANGLPLPHFRWVDTSTNRTIHGGDTLVVDSTHAGALSCRCTATNIVRGRTYRKHLQVAFSVAVRPDPEKVPDKVRDVIWTGKEETLAANSNRKSSYIIGAVFVGVVLASLLPVIFCVFCTGINVPLRSAKMNTILQNQIRSKTEYQRRMLLASPSGYHNSFMELSDYKHKYTSKVNDFRDRLRYYQLLAKQAGIDGSSAEFELQPMNRRTLRQHAHLLALPGRSSTSKGHGDHA